ncbi:unnamed protein product [Ilex paraguariensis]|uniref:Uncharacterized protein n=1 Tax=Ilex paraguariensis TaxID=185542 RepID=A0ABC8TVD7_9AQUA
MISNTEAIRSFLASASANPHLSQDLQQTAAELSSQSSVPYKSLRSLWSNSNLSTRPDIVALLSGSHFIFSSPKPREKSEELKARLRKLAEVAERNAYEELVKDITPKKSADEPFSAYKDQLGFETVLPRKSIWKTKALKIAVAIHGTAAVNDVISHIGFCM